MYSSVCIFKRLKSVMLCLAVSKSSLGKMRLFPECKERESPWFCNRFEKDL